MAIIGFILGTVLGSFIKVVADRSLSGRSFFGRSHCENCKNKLKWFDLLPILSYLFLKGKCRYCKKAVSIEYLIVEVVMGILVGFLFWQSFSSLQSTAYSLQFKNILFFADLLFKIFFISVLVALFLTDLKKMLIPDRIILPSIIIAAAYLLIMTIFKAEPLLTGFLMAAIIGGFFWALIIITKGQGMGGGDVKLGAFIGLALGFPNALIALFISFLSGAVVSLLLIGFGKKHFGQFIPFGPFLSLGSLIALFWGQNIYNWYLHL